MPISRRAFVQGVSAAGLAGLMGAAASAEGPDAHIRKTSMPSEPLTTEPHTLSAVPIENVVIDDAFWAPKREVWRTVTLHDCLRKFDEGGAFANFDRVRDGQSGDHKGFPWFDGLIYEMIRAASDFLRSKRDPELEAQLDGYVTRIVEAAKRDPGGYVNTYTQLGETNQRWGLNGGLEVWQHEFYNLGALVDAGVHYYRATGKTALLDAGVRIANTISDLLGPSPKKNLVPAHELPEEAMLGLYELLEENSELKSQLSAPADSKRYLALAEFWIENRGVSSGKPDWEKGQQAAEEYVRHCDYSGGRPTWGEYAQDHKRFTEQDEIVGHAVRATLFCSAIAALARVNGRDEYRSSALRLWENMTYRRMHITGGVGAFADQEKFGPDYVLPNDAYLETCAAVGAGFFHANMNRAFGHAAYADELERTLYNGILCGVSLKGDTYTYQNPLVADEGRQRWSWHDCPCCPPMFLKMMGAMPGYIYATDHDSAYVNLFVGSYTKLRLKGVEIALTQKTEYPWDGTVRLSIEPSEPAKFGLMLRIPAWCPDASLHVNGEKVSTARLVRGYARIERTWHPGDTVELRLPMPVREMHAHPKVTANIGRVALTRGPIVYCLESVDYKGDWQALRLAGKSSFSTRFAPDQLGGIAVLEGSAFEAEPSQLYASAFPMSQVRQLTAIPFYANGNRGPAKMAVWLPVDIVEF